MSEDELSLLASKFSAAHTPEGGEDRRGGGANEEGGRAEENYGDTVDYDAFVRWISEGAGLDDELLGKVQRHLKARLSK